MGPRPGGTATVAATGKHQIDRATKGRATGRAAARKLPGWLWGKLRLFDCVELRRGRYARNEAQTQCQQVLRHMVATAAVST